MKNKINIKLSILLLLASFISVPLLPPATAAAAGCDTPNEFTLLPPWYKGLKCTDSSIDPPASQDGGLQGMIYRVILNVIEALFYIVGYVALGMIIWGGFKYMLNGDNPGGMEAAKKTIMNAVIGIVISIFAITIVNLIAGTFN